MGHFKTAIFLGFLCVTARAQLTNLVFRLDGSSYVTILDSANIQRDDQITVETWVNPVAGGSLINKGDGQDGISQRSYELKWSNGTLKCAVYFALPVEGGQPAFAEVVAPLNAGVWAHVAGVYDSVSGLKLYTNGVLASAMTSYSGLPFLGLKLRQTSLPLVLGSTPPFANTFFNGALDEIRVWATARSEQQIKDTEFARLSAGEQGLLGYWNFDDGTISDLSASGRGATMIGTPVILSFPGLDVIHRFMKFAPGWLSSGRFTTTVQSVPTISLSIEVSNDLKTWDPFISLTTPGDFGFADTQTTNFEHRFFRAISR